MQKFSQEQLMQYLYNEASPILIQSIELALKEDKKLANEIKALQQTKRYLEYLAGQLASPSDASVDAIMNYAKKTGARAKKDKSV